MVYPPATKWRFGGAENFSKISAFFLIVLGCTVLVGWVFDLTLLKSLVPGQTSVKPNTAVCFLLFGASLLLLQRSSDRRRGLVAKLIAVIPVVVGALTIYEYFSGANLQIDQFFFREPAPVNSLPGRMSPISALCFLASGLALIAMDRKAKLATSPAQLLALGSLVCAMLPMADYLLDGNMSITGVALQTIPALLVLSAGILFARPTEGLTKLFFYRDISGVVARRLTVVILFIPLVLGALRWLTESLGMKSIEETATVTIVVLMSLLLGAVWWTTEMLHEAEEARMREQHRVAVHFGQSLVGNYISTPAGKLLDCNAAFLRIFGYTSIEEARRVPMSELYVYPSERIKVIERVRKEKSVDRYEMAFVRRDRTTGVAILNAVGHFDAQGELAEILGCLIDDTEHRKREQMLLHAQKLEAIGKLSGGVAHDFNNILGIIIGYSELLQNKIAKDDELQHMVKAIVDASERAASLTRQLLSFSRQQVLQPTILNLNSVIAEMDKMLQRLIRENIRIESALEPRLQNVKADGTQVQQVLLNLVINARDAMPEGGKITIETQNCILDELYVAQHPGVSPGPYVMLAVSDTGVGMSPEIQSHVFEPFFTTKEPGKGTGLGLATVYGVVQQSGGSIQLYSEAGRGTTFKIYLPAVSVSEEKKEEMIPQAVRGGSETILVVEDCLPLLEITSRTLRAAGYKVIEAEDPSDALALAEMLQEPLPLLVADVVMPGMNGTQLASLLRRSRPEMQVLFLSGYTDHTVLDHDPLLRDAAFLQKPCTGEDLRQKVRELLNLGHKSLQGFSEASAKSPG